MFTPSAFFVTTNINQIGLINKHICRINVFYIIFMQKIVILHIEDKNITKLFVVIHKNRVVSISKTVEEMIRDFNDIYPDFKNRNNINKHFKDNDIYYIQNAVSGEQYIIQKIVNSNKKK